MKIYLLRHAEKTSSNGVLTERGERAAKALAREKGIPFLEAATLYNDKEVLDGIAAKAKELNELLGELQGKAGEGTALVVSHDLSISPAMSQKGVPLQSVDFLHGYVIQNDGSAAQFNPGTLSEQRAS